MNRYKQAGYPDRQRSLSCDFPLQNLPFGVFSTLADSCALRVGVAIGDLIVDLAGH